MSKLTIRRSPVHQRSPVQQTTEVPTEIAEAQSAVDRYEDELQQLTAMKKEFRETYRDAHHALMDIQRQHDLVQEAIQEAHPLVQKAKQSFGEFKCVRKWNTAGYGENEFTELIGDHKNGGKILVEMIKAGVVKKISLDKAATAFFAQRPEYAKAFSTAWHDKSEKTAAVTTPKPPVL